MLDDNNPAWAILLPDEQTAITLSMGYHKSTWEAGEIMGKAHYKFLEIKSRGETYLKMFTEYFDEFKTLVPEDTFLHRDFVFYIEEVILKRKTKKETSDANPKTLLFVEAARDRLISEQIEKLKKANDDHHQALLKVISEFDRWNNFRILPYDAQEPSAFKRRNKTRNRKHINKLASLPPVSIKLIIQRYEYTGKYDKLYVPLVTDIDDNGYYIMSVKDKELVRKELSKMGLFAYVDKDDAEEFADTVYDYTKNKVKTCKQGQKFWPFYRILSEKAINWKEVNNIIPKRKYLENALDDLHIIGKELPAKRNDKKIQQGATRTKSSDHYK